MSELQDGEPFVYMKVGIHAKESLQDIIARKRKEIADAGVSFWGYGGSTCHPLNAVQPFVRDESAHGVTVRLLMQEIDSRHFAENVRAESYSEDGLVWKPVPKPINVLGSRYALVISSLDEIELSVSLKDTKVGVGRFQGSSGLEYVRGHVDKACLIYSPTSVASPEAKIIPLKLSAKLTAPYAVLLKNPV
jgi:hypothetical protein